MTQRFNRTTGLYEEQQQDGSWRPMSQAAFAAAAGPTTVGGPRAPSSGGAGPTPEPRGPIGTPGMMNPLSGMLGAFSPQTPSNAGSIIGSEVRTQGPLDFGEPEISASDREFLNSLQGLLSGIGGTPLPPPARLPEAPTYTVDPGLDVRATNARERYGRIDQLLNNYMSQMKEADPRNRSRWARLGEWLSAVAASGDLSQAGALMAQLNQEGTEFGQEYNEASLRAALQGEGFAADADEAEAAVASGRHGAAERTTEAGYSRDLTEAQMLSNYALQAYEAQQRSANARASLGATIAEAQRDARRGARDEWRGAIGLFADDPRYASQAAEALIPESIADPRTRSALGDSLTGQQARQGFVAYVTAMHGNRANTRTLLPLLRQFDPTITEQFINDNTLQGVLFRALGSPNADRVLAANPQLSRYASFATAE